MAQFLRPDSNITQSSFTGGFADIDETSPSDADYAYGANNTSAVLEVGLSDPSVGTPGSGTTTVRYRIAKVNNGTVSGTGNNLTVTMEVYQGGTLIASDTSQTPTGTWTQYEFNPDMSGVTDWTDLRLRFSTTGSGGSPANRRGGAISWAELEAPDPPAAVTHATDGALTGQGSSVAGTAARAAGAVTHATDGALTGQGSAVAGTAARTRQHATDGALAGQSTTLSGSAARTRQHATTGALDGQGAALAGAAERTRLHATTGALDGQGASIVGAAARVGGAVTHDTSGALSGQSSTVAGAAARTRQHATDGALAAQGAAIVGSASRAAGPVTHATDGVLAGQQAVVVGAADRATPGATHDTTGALVAGSAQVTGTAKRNTIHATTGSLVGPGSVVVGAASGPYVPPVTNGPESRFVRAFAA